MRKVGEGVGVIDGNEFAIFTKTNVSDNLYESKNRKEIRLGHGHRAKPKISITRK